MERLGKWQADLGPWGGALWRGSLRGSATFLILIALWLFSLAMGRDHSPLLVLGWGGWIAISVGLTAACDARWGEGAPWRTTFLCTFIGWASCLGAIAQWGYLGGISGGQIAGWQSALRAPLAVKLDVWVGLAGSSQLLGATVLVRRGRGLAAICWANVAVSLVAIPIGLFVVCEFEDWVWSALERRAAWT